MTEPERALIARLSSDVAVAGAHLARASADLAQLDRLVASRSSQPPLVQPAGPPRPVPTVPTVPVSAQPAAPEPLPRSDSWIGKALAVAGVAVTLVGVTLLLILAERAGILRPEVRVGMGVALAAGLGGAAWRLQQRPGGRVGAIALAATAIAAVNVDVVAVTTIYGWVPAAAGLVIAAAAALAGLSLARRWDTEALGLLVLVPLMGLAPVVAGGFTPLLVGFMLAQSIASVPAGVGRDWTGMHAARMAVGTFPLLIAMMFEPSAVLAGAGAVAAALAIGSTLILLPHSTTAWAMALVGAAATTPLLVASLVVDGPVAALLAASLSAVLVGILLAGARLPMVTEPVATVWSVLAAVSALVAVTVAFDGPVAGPVLLALSLIVAVAGRSNQAAWWSAVGFGVAGLLYSLVVAPLTTLVVAPTSSTSVALATLIAATLLIVVAVEMARSRPSDWSRACAAVGVLYGITRIAVTAGVLLGGQTQGFFAGHVAATICWVALAAGVLRHAARGARARRSLPIGGAMAVVAASVAKLFLFDLGTLDGIFRVVVFIVVGLALLGMGAGYARTLAQHDERELVT